MHFRRDTAGSQLNCEMSRVAVHSAGDGIVEYDMHYDTYSREFGSACQTGGGGGGGSGSGGEH